MTTTTNYPERLDDLIEGAGKTGFTLDYIEALTRGLDQSATNSVLENLVHMDPELVHCDNPRVRRHPTSRRGDDVGF